MAKPTETEMTRDMPALSLRAEFRPGTVNEEKRTVDLIWTTGAKVLRGFWDQYWEELSLDPKHVRMGRLNNGAPFLDSHRGYDSAAVYGVVESAALNGKEGVATVRFAKAEDDPDADKVFRKIKDGILQNVSVGYRVHKLEKVESAEANPKAEIPTYRAVDWEPYELSVVPMGADDGAGFRSGAVSSPNPCVFVTPRQESHMNEEQKPAAAEPVTAPAVNEDEVRAAAVKAERERASGIRLAVRAGKLDEKFAEELIEKGVSLDAARAAVLDKLATASEAIVTEQHVRIEAGEDRRDKFVRGASASIFQRAMIANAIRNAQKTDVAREMLADVELDPGEFRGMSLVDLARYSLEANGVSTRGMDKMRMVGLALTQRAGTGDFPILLETAMHKSLVAGYATTPNTWQRFCSVASASDFRSHTAYRIGSFGTLDEVSESGEFKNKAIPDGEKASYSVKTKGNIVAITRQAIVNDDLGAFTSLGGGVGSMAARSIETDVYALINTASGLGPTLGDSVALFNAAHANIGTQAALSMAALDADRVVMASQKDPSKNDYLDLRPAILLLNVGLEGAARAINESETDVSQANPKKPNIVRGLFRDIIGTPRISGNRRYLLADPSVAPVFQVAFLDGQQSPVLESQEGWRVDGTEWKVRLDYGVAAIDFRGAVTNAG